MLGKQFRGNTLLVSPSKHVRGVFARVLSCHRVSVDTNWAGRDVDTRWWTCLIDYNANGSLGEDSSLSCVATMSCLEGLKKYNKYNIEMFVSNKRRQSW